MTSSLIHVTSMDMDFLLGLLNIGLDHPHLRVLRAPSSVCHQQGPKAQ